MTAIIVLLFLLFPFFWFNALVKNYSLKKKISEKEKGGYILKSEYDRLHNEYISAMLRYNPIERQLRKMEEWHGSYIKNEMEETKNFLYEKNQTPLERAAEFDGKIISKTIVQESKPKKFNPADLSYQELEACTNYFVENQHQLKNQSK